MDGHQLEQVVVEALCRATRIPPPQDLSVFFSRTLQQIWDDCVVHIGGGKFPYDGFVFELQILAGDYHEEFRTLTSADIISNKDIPFPELIGAIGAFLYPKD